MSLTSKRIIVTGAASGIGRGTAIFLAAAGARIGLLDRDVDGLNVTAKAIGAARAQADIANAGQARAAVDSLVGQLGGLDGLVNCAGVDLIRDFDATGADDWQHVLGVNLMGPVHVCQAALAALRQGTKPAIVNISSAAALRPLAQRTAYCSSKAALVMFSKALAIDLAADGIRVNAICPGIVDTPMLRASIDSAPDPALAEAAIMDRYLIKRAGLVDEIAASIAFLLDDAAGYITGSTLAVDGGRSFY